MLINCVVYENGTKLADIPVSEISEYASLPGSFVWVALRDPSTQELAEVQEEFGLHPLGVEDAQHGHQRPIATATTTALLKHAVAPLLEGTGKLYYRFRRAGWV
ncbi:hypothetical protein WDL1CHR_04198 [Variovorax sp. WDL1]|nr:Magnesium and cobalt transport protein CorA [Variovorax sp. WDL1]PNG59639.1 hypothetical protein CHC07_01367 [Variovorax sp. B4]PNG60570.1 hypothetical protein CHC06_00468 [Variovorax sp. B2]VTV13541.1 hypothetical protein WDL1CHR_04198 [Variovorax sp. WDL1]